MSGNLEETAIVFFREKYILFVYASIEDVIDLASCQYVFAVHIESISFPILYRKWVDRLINLVGS